MLREQETTGRIRRAALLASASLILAIIMTWPLASGLGSLGRTGARLTSDGHFGDNGDGLFSVWNVSWVARTLVADPVHLFDANIFHPHRNSLAYSEANLIAGLAGVPVWWTTRNPYATLNVVILLGFSTAYLCAWLLARRLTGDPRGRDRRGHFLRVLPLRFLTHLAHPADAHGRDSPRDADDAPPGGRAVGEARRCAWRRAGCPGARVRLLRHLFSIDGGLRRAVLLHQPRACAERLVVERCRCRGDGIDCRRGPLPVAVHRPSTGGRVFEDAGGCGALFGECFELPDILVSGAWLAPGMDLHLAAVCRGHVPRHGAAGVCRCRGHRCAGGALQRRSTRTRDRAVVRLARNSRVLGVIRPQRGLVPPALSHSNVLVPPRAVADGNRRRAVPRGAGRAGAATVARPRRFETETRGRHPDRCRGSGARDPAVSVGARAGCPVPCTVCSRRCRRHRLRSFRFTGDASRGTCTPSTWCFQRRTGCR